MAARSTLWVRGFLPGTVLVQNTLVSLDMMTTFKSAMAMEYAEYTVTRLLLKLNFWSTSPAESINVLYGVAVCEVDDPPDPQVDAHKADWTFWDGVERGPLGAERAAGVFESWPIMERYDLRGQRKVRGMYKTPTLVVKNLDATNAMYTCVYSMLIKI